MALARTQREWAILVGEVSYFTIFCLYELIIFENVLHDESELRLC